MSFTPAEPQYLSAKRLYNPRSHSYNDSWHPSFAGTFVSHLSIQPGQHVLDLACGTGLVSFLAANIVGPSGSVVGVDVSEGMLAQAIARKEREKAKFPQLQFHNHDVLDLDSLESLEKESFDFITLASAFVLFPDPKAALKHWLRYLKPGGIIALDVTHPQNLAFGNVIERVANRMRVSIPYYRQWVKSEDSLKEILEGGGLAVQKIIRIDNQAGYGKRLFDVSEADDVFEKNINGEATKDLGASATVKDKAKEIFRDEWSKAAVDGKVGEVDTVFLGIAQKEPDTSAPSVAFTGGCRCGGVRYLSTIPPEETVYCHCSACRKLSGSAFLPWIECQTSSIEFIVRSTLQTLRLSEVADRMFCNVCGTPISMTYKAKPHYTSLTMGSIDDGSVRCIIPPVKLHIFLKEKAPWMVLPDDGASRYDEFSSN
ncbi:S-adenosyl-L-methionine-dependent methyltransferase [Glonium stellatum]|uniref:S-adenosyl-L-methionine-dependent methyltransferase n=1 Tax=Glonium stellatum TaxID=574774 RepID=A0A8E2JNK4_9PEZI|nr:S-adenosyl-L-methionine-dependent methyltransferase [Glonium stellatum]